MSSLLRLSLLFKRSPIDLRPIVALQFVTSIIRVVINLLHAAASSASSTVSKSYRLLQVAREIIEARPGMELEVLDLSRLASEYGRNIHPCKACFSTAPALCHWPCSCYPNHSLGQTHDWMNEIYPMVTDVRRSISDWLCYMHLCPAGPVAELDRYIGYWNPYATSHDELDADAAVQEEVRNAARALLEGVLARRSGTLVTSGEELRQPRQK